MRSYEKISGSLKNIWERFSRTVSNGYSSFRHAISLAARRTYKTVYGVLGKISEDLSRAGSAGYPYYRHPLPIRIMHWSNAVFLFVLLMSGLNIFNAHPALYWGISSYQGVPPILEIPDGFPSWLTIPGNRWLAMARRWHLFFAWLLVVNGAAYIAYSLASRHLHRDLVPTGRDWRSIGRSIIDHVHFVHPTGEASRYYNVLQKLAYLGVIFFLLPLMVLMGLGMSPGLDAIFPGWVDLFDGRQSIRTIHFIIAWALVLFVIIHVFEVIVTGFWNNFRSMITGYYRVKSGGDHE